MFGDTEPWDVSRTITNALTRGPRTIQIDDVEIQETEARTQACVALLVDTSFSMAMEGRWVPMKRTALALHTLVTSRFRGDDLQLIGFGRSASVMQIEQLVGLDEKWEKGTNLHHALLLANRHFRKHPNAQPVLLSSPTASRPPTWSPAARSSSTTRRTRLTIALAVRELDGSARLGARTTFFRLGDDPGLARFVDAMAKRAGGTVVAPEADDLGAAVSGRTSARGATAPSAGGVATTSGDRTDIVIEPRGGDDDVP